MDGTALNDYIRVAMKNLNVPARPMGRTFNEKESRCSFIFNYTIREFGAFFHLCTPGTNQSVIFSRVEDYTFAMTLIAICSYECQGIAILTFELMSNHIHVVLAGTEEEARRFFSLFKKRYKRYLALTRSSVDLSGFEIQVIPIETLDSLRNQLCYTNRNNYIVNPDFTPFTYPYGANSYYFNPQAKRLMDSYFRDLTVAAKRDLTHSKNIDYPEKWAVIDGYFSPSSYCSLDIGEGVFRDARHYFHKVSRDIESYKEIASTLGDLVYYTDDELVSVTYLISSRDYGGIKPNLLGYNEKIDIAKKLHYEYKADNAKIARILKLREDSLDQIFPSKNIRP